ncbi:hypothetical protein [Dictyobacter aurantiacus]|uniref:Mersacidin/lichenicidin family type 2 lantibiotic n=1 Tax=Dictyobacter aurantiacus TaxID=1936993 RepID=A0A401ZL28_9CHLR|nr:hypothetical protein [Dictyobacter aurantiacus]GCE07532.1 hypothetical protein KDAU_48610 [Dictyobacter aurantiacus]
MSIEEIIRAWKAGTSEDLDQHLPENPIGNELSDQELAEAIGSHQGQDWMAMPNTETRRPTKYECWCKPKKH